jgi:5-methylcytosine-specific restriction endonuclease McrA
MPSDFAHNEGSTMGGKGSGARPGQGAGRVIGEEERQKKSEAQKRRWARPEELEKKRAWSASKTHSEETKQKMSETNRQRRAEESEETRQSRSEKIREAMLTSGRQNNLRDLLEVKRAQGWKPSGRPPTSRSRTSKFYEDFRDSILDRDGHQCVKCGATSGGAKNGLSIHHFQEFEGGDGLLDYEPSNVETLCIRCHNLLREVLFGKTRLPVFDQ